MKLTLEEWRHLIGYHPYHFWQLANDVVPVHSECNTLIAEYNWQNSMIQGRDGIRLAIEQSEEQLSNYLGYSVGASFKERMLQYPINNHDQWRTSDTREGWKSVHVGEGYIHALGVKQLEQIGQDAEVAYSSSYGNVTDTFEIVLQIPSTLDFDYIEVQYIPADWLDFFDDDRKQIKDFNYTLSEDKETLTITGRSWVMVKPSVYQSPIFMPIDPDDTSETDIFVQSVNVYAVTSSGQGQSVSDAPVVLQYDRGDLCSDDLSYMFRGVAGVYWENAEIQGVKGTQVIKVPASGQIQHGRTGRIGIPSSSQPDRVTLRYLSGSRYNSVDSPFRDATEWKKTTARLAAANLAQRICTCDVANQQLYEWQFDRALASGENGTSYILSEDQLSNPFGTREGQIYAYQRVRYNQMTRGIAV